MIGRLNSQNPKGAVPPYILATPRVPILGNSEDGKGEEPFSEFEGIEALEFFKDAKAS